MGINFLFGATVTIVKHLELWPTIAMGGVFAAILLWLWTTKLTIGSDALHYRSLFVRRDVPLADIVGARFVTGSSSTKPYQRLVVTVKGKSGRRDITINTGLFDLLKSARG
jgi:hypothetical protein